MSLKVPIAPNQEVSALEGAVFTPPVAVPPGSTPAPRTEKEWAAAIRCDLETGTTAYISAGRKLIEAKKALKGTNRFIYLVTDLLGHDLDTAERWMEIARHPVLSDSANSRILPTAWTTLYTLARIPAHLLLEYIADGTVHARLSGKEATQLLKRGANRRRNRDGDAAGHGGDHGGDHSGCDHQHAGDHQHTADPAGNVPAANTMIDPNSQGEIERKLARLDELERETRRQAIQLAGYESEVAELKAKLGSEPPIRAQRKLFQQALRSLRKAEIPGTLQKERRALKQHATSDFVELVRSAVRDGLKPERFDLVYRPEVH